MKKLLQSLVAITLLGAGVFGLSRSSKAQCFISIDPNNNAASISIYSPFANTLDYSPADNPAAFVNTVFSAPPAVPPGTYLGWCIDTVDNISFGPTLFNTRVFSSCDPNIDIDLPANYPASVYVDAATWQKVNYLLNHKGGAYFWNIQYAIWTFIGGPDPDPSLLPGYPPTDPAQIVALVNDANANAATWLPKCGDVIAVVVAVQNGGDPLAQLTIIEVPVPCTPSITVTKDVACLQPNDNCGTFSKLAEGFKGLNDPAFCYSITVSNSGTMNLTNVVIMDSLLGDITTNFFPSGIGFLAPGQSVPAILKLSLGTTTTNTATATALALNADASAGASVTNSDSAVAIVENAAITCQVSLTSTCDADGNPNDNHVLLPGCGETCTVNFSVVVYNAGASALTGVTLSSSALPGFNCTLPAPFDLAPGASNVYQCSMSMTCSNKQNLDVQVAGTVIADSTHCGVYDITSSNLISVSSSCSGVIECAPCRCTSIISGFVVLHCDTTILSLAGDSALSNLLVTLLDSNNVPVTATNTDVTGAYAFSNLTAGTYTVVVTPPANYTETYPSGLLTGKLTVTLAECQNTNHVDFGFSDQNIPVIKGIPAGQYLNCNPLVSAIPTDAYILSLITASDDRGPITGSALTVTHPTLDVTNGCTVSRTFTITAKGTCATGTGSVTYTWTFDNTIPVLTYVPAGTNYGCNPSSNSLPTVATISKLIKASDNCGLKSTNVTCKDVVSSCGVVRTFTITVTDNCNNTSVPQYVAYAWGVDTTLPLISHIPNGTNYGCNPASAILPTDASIKALVQATDNCTLVATNVTHTDTNVNCVTTRTFCITAVDSCNNTSLVSKVSYTWTVDTTVPLLTCPPDITISNTVPAYCTYAPGDWGASCNNSNAACILTNCFKRIYSSGWLQCGSGNYVKFNSGNCARIFASCGGNPSYLKNTYSNPTTCEAGSFAAAVLALQLNVDFGDNKSITGFGAGCGDLVINDPTCSLNGKSIRQVLAICNTALGGGNVSSYGCTLSSLSTLCANLNQCYQGGKPSDWCNGHIIPPTITNVPPSISGYATVVDKCGGSPSLTNIDVITPGTCPGTYTIARTWVAVDACGNSNTCTQLIHVGNTTGSICGYVFQDCNGDGHLTPGIDYGMSNTVVNLKNANGTVIATTTTDANGSYCFYNLNAGSYSVCINQPTSAIQTAGCHTNHWMDNSGNDCWVDNDGYQHWKGGNGVDCWNANDGCQHYKNSYGQDCWKDNHGNTHTQNCNYTSCNVPKNNCETFTLGACEAKTSVNFSYQGVAPKATCTVTGPSKGVCGQTLTYTCTVVNNGNTCFSACQVSACGNNYNCPALKPGEKCTFPINYTCRNSDYGTFKCNANASCSYAGSSNPCTSQASCSTQVSYH